MVLLLVLVLLAILVYFLLLHFTRSAVKPLALAKEVPPDVSGSNEAFLAMPPQFEQVPERVEKLPVWYWELQTKYPTVKMIPIPADVGYAGIDIVTDLPLSTLLEMERLARTSTGFPALFYFHKDATRQSRSFSLVTVGGLTEIDFLRPYDRPGTFYETMAACMGELLSAQDAKKYPPSGICNLLWDYGTPKPPKGLVQLCDIVLDTLVRLPKEWYSSRGVKRFQIERHKGHVYVKPYGGLLRWDRMLAEIKAI
jgi:hypothetical protein